MLFSRISMNCRHDENAQLLADKLTGSSKALTGNADDVNSTRRDSRVEKIIHLLTLLSSLIPSG